MDALLDSTPTPLPTLLLFDASQMLPASPSFASPSHARIGACIALAVMLNMAAIGIAAELSSARPDVAPADADTPTRVSVVLVPAAGAPVARGAGTVLTTASSVVEHPRTFTAMTPAARTTREATLAPATQPTLFYGFQEVDSPAYPTSDWNLDVDALDAIGVTRLVFEVLISDGGDVVGCTVLDPTELTDDVRRRLEQRLSETTLEPARRAGQLVASMRRIELVVAPVQPESLLTPAARQP